MGVLSNPVASTDIGLGNGLRAREGIKIPRLLCHSNPMGDNVFYVGNFIVGNNRIFLKPIGAFCHSPLIRPRCIGNISGNTAPFDFIAQVIGGHF